VIVTDNSAVIAALNERIAELEKERDELKAHTVALELDFDSALDIAESCANNPSVVDANKSFQEFVSYTTIESTLEAHNLEQQAKECTWIYSNVPDLSNGNYIKIKNRASHLLNQAKALKDQEQTNGMDAVWKLAREQV
tara:strand:+ start:311 stop:727 length:417 start_codon:yes stop_codon:yes gene_type:complete